MVDCEVCDTPKDCAGAGRCLTFTPPEPSAECAHEWMPMVGGAVCYGCNQMRRYDSVTYAAPQPIPSPPEPSAVQEAREAARQSYEYRVAKANGYADHFETAWDALIAAVRAERPAPAPSVTSTNLPPGTTTTYINPATIAFTAPAPRVTEGDVLGAGLTREVWRITADSASHFGPVDHQPARLGGDSDDESTGWYLHGYQQWSALFRGCNWYDFTVLKVHGEYAPYSGRWEAEFWLLGFGVVLTYVYDGTFNAAATLRAALMAEQDRGAALCARCGSDVSACFDCARREA